MEPVKPGQHLVNDAKEYWKEYLPQAYKRLEEQGKLEEHLWARLDQMLEMEFDLHTQGLPPSGAREVAWPILFPPSEEELTEEAEELKERFPEG